MHNKRKGWKRLQHEVWNTYGSENGPLVFIGSEKYFLDPIRFSTGTKISHFAGWKTPDDRISVYNANRDHLFKGAEN